MNEKIKELAKQAGWGKGQSYDDCIQCSPFNPEEFAELIVRECLDKIENEAAQYAEPVWAVELINDIKEHFGVK